MTAKSARRLAAMVLVAAGLIPGATAAETGDVPAQRVAPGFPVATTPVMVSIAPPMFAPPMFAPPMPLRPEPPPASAAAAAVMAPPAMARGVYIVKKGAHLAVVARRTGTALAAIIALNPTLDPTALLPAGTRVTLPIAGIW